MFRRWSRRYQNNQLRPMLLTHLTQTLNPGNGDGFKLRTCRNGRFRLDERKKLFSMGNNVTEDVCSNDVACVPEHTRMRQQEVTRGSVIHLQIGSYTEDVPGVEEHHRSIVLTHAVFEKAIHPDAQDHHLRPCTLTKKTLQPIQPVIVTRGFKKDGIDTHPAGGHFLQAVYLDSVHE